jgi:hypothetical protein
VNLADAKLFAEEIVKVSEKKEFFGNKLSPPNERMLNLARCFLHLSEQGESK